nr:hypothetical protein [Tanacetum cinerariifolium]
MDVKSDFLYEKIEEEMYVCQPPGFEDPYFRDRVYKVKKALYGLHQAPRAWFIKVKTASTPMETQKPLLKDEDGEEVDVHMYRLMIGSLMNLTSSRPNIMFAVCACARYQVNPKVSHLYAVKRIFRYLKGQPKLSLWYPKDSPFDLVAYTDCDYARASLDKKSTTGEAEYVAALSCRAQVLWIQNQLLDYGFAYKSVDVSRFQYLIASSVLLVILNTAELLLLVTLTTVRNPTRMDTQVPQPSGPTDSIADEVVHKELGDRLVRAATTASSLEAEQDSGQGIMIEEPVKPKKKDQIRLDEEAAKKLQAEFDEKEGLQEEKIKKKKKPTLL